MKFKVAVISLLSAILVVCLFTAYTLIDRANRQLELQKVTAYIALEKYELDYDVIGVPDKQEFVSKMSMQYENKIKEICGTD